MAKGKCLEVFVGLMNLLLLAIAVLAWINAMIVKENYKNEINLPIIVSSSNFILIILMCILTIIGIKKKNRFFLLLPLIFVLIIAIVNVVLCIYFTFFMSSVDLSKALGQNYTNEKESFQFAVVLRSLLFASFVYYIITWITMLVLYKRYARSSID